MGFRINTNINAIDTQRNLMMTGTNMATTMRRLSSGLRINSAADDAAGLAISQKLNAQVQGLNQAVRNAQDGISLVQTGEGALNETQSILQRMRQLAVQSSNDTNTQTDRTAIQSEMNQLATEMSRISNTTSFNTKNLLAGGFKNQSLQIGANSGESMSFSINAMDAASLGVAGNGAAVSSTKNSANIQTVTGVGSGYANAVNYTVNSQALSAGTLTDAVGTATNTGANQGQNIGTESLSSAWVATTPAPTGFANADSVTMNGFTSRVSGVSADGKSITQVQVQQAGSTSWSTVNGAQQSNGTYKFNVAGAFTDTTSSSSATINMQYSFTSGATAPHVGDQFSQAAVTGPITVAGSLITVFGTGTSFNTTSTANSSGAIAVTAGQNQGNESLNVAGAFAGSATTNYLMKVTGVSATSPSQVSSVQFSTNGGSTWANATATLQNNGSYNFQTQQSSSGGSTGSGGDSGMSFSFNAPLNMVPPAIGDTFNLQAVAGTNSTGAAGAATNIGLQTVGTGANNASFTASGTYKGALAGAIAITTGGAVTNATGLTAALVTGVSIGGVALNASQYSFTAANTLQVDGLTIGTNASAGTGLAAGTNAITSVVTPESLGQSASLAGAASVTFGNSAGTVPTMSATVTSQATSQAALTGGLASAQSMIGLGAGSIVLKYTGGGTNTLLLGYNGVNNAVAFSAGVSTTVAGGSNTVSVTGADTKTYKMSLSNVTATSATVSIQDSAATPNTLSSFTVAISSLGATNDAMAINVSPNMLNTNTTDTMNANNANNPVVASTNLGAEQASVSGTYNGTTNQQFTAKVTSLDSFGNATQIQVSTDGGKTYGSTITSTGTPTAAATQTAFSLGNGLTFNVTPGQANQNSTAVGDTFGFLATASAANGGTGTNLLQLQYTDANSKTYNMGAGALLQAGQTSTQLGAGTMAMTANFGAYGSAGSVGNGATTITSQGSAAATIGANDFVVSNAIAYAGLDVTSQANAQAAISTIDTAINTVSLQRAQMGAIQNRLQHTINNLSVGSENLSAAQSRIQDVDVAAETVNMTKNSILTQAGISILSQANQQPQMVMKLLQ